MVSMNVEERKIMQNDVKIVSSLSWQLSGFKHLYFSPPPLGHKQNFFEATQGGKKAD